MKIKCFKCGKGKEINTTKNVAGKYACQECILTSYSKLTELRKKMDR